MDFSGNKTPASWGWARRLGIPISYRTVLVLIKCANCFITMEPIRQRITCYNL